MNRSFRTVPLLLALLAAALFAAPASAEVRTMTFKSKRAIVAQYQAKIGKEDVPAPEIDGNIVEMEAHVVDENGVRIPQSEVMLHHLVFFNGGSPGAKRHDGACPSSHIGQRFYGTSEELRPLTLPQGYGYPIGAMDHWRMAWMLMNHTHIDRKAWIQWTIKVDDAPGLQPVTPYWYNVMPCGLEDPQYTVPGGGLPGSTNVKRRVWTAPRSGRIVAIGGHAHGGNRGVALGSRRCATELFTSRPTYGMPDNPVYQVKPLLHEPDPLNMSWWQSATGRPVLKGEKLVVTSSYDAAQAHMRVMGIIHAYVAEGVAPGAGCEPPPSDAQVLGPDWQGRPEPPVNQLTLARVFRDGIARPITRPPGRSKTFAGNGTSEVSALSFSPANISVPAGSSVRWRFHDLQRHDATLAVGPRGFAVPWSRAGEVRRQRFTTPGKYRIFCSLHPAQMSQVVTVRKKR